jgi:DNA repair exonuclease SbcCD ATPase subunit
MSPFHQRTIEALSHWLGSWGPSTRLPGSHEARFLDAYDALEAQRQELKETLSQVRDNEEDTSKEDRIAELEDEIEDAHALLADLRGHIELLDGGHSETPELLRRIAVLTGEVAE